MLLNQEAFTRAKESLSSELNCILIPLLSQQIECLELARRLKRESVVHLKHNFLDFTPKSRFNRTY
jgi:hypothetical protein